MTIQFNKPTLQIYKCIDGRLFWVSSKENPLINNSLQSILYETVDYRPIEARNYKTLIGTRLYDNRPNMMTLSNWVIEKVESYTADADSQYHQIVILLCKYVPLDLVNKLESTPIPNNQSPITNPQ